MPALSKIGAGLLKDVKQAPLSTVYAGLAFVGLLIMPSAVALHLGRGLDLSDSGYYNASISYLSDTRMAVTQFGVVWNLLPVPDDIVARRVVLFLLVAGSSLWVAMESISLLGRGHRQSAVIADRLLFAGVGIGSGVFYASLWLVDPSYNSTALVLCCCLVALAVRVVRKRANAPVSFAAAGLAIVLLLYVRQPTAAALGVVLAVFVLALARPGLGQLIRLSGLAMLGMIGAIGLIWLLVEAPWVTWSRFQGGLEFTAALARDENQFERLVQFLEMLVDVALEAWFLLLFAFLSFASGAIARLRLRVVQRVLAGCVSVALTSLIGLNYSALPDQPQAHYAFLGQTVGLLALVALGAAIGRVVATLRLKRRALAIRRLGLVLILVLAGVAAVYWTGNVWFPRLAWVAVLPVLALLVAIHTSDRWQVFAATMSVVIVLGLLQTAGWKAMSGAPYRLPGGLDTQTIPTQVRHGQSVVRADEATHALFNRLAQGSAELAGCEGDARPVLLDLSGSLPMVAYHINARPPGRSWILAGYPGSPDLFAQVVDRLDDATLQSAWILDAPGFQYRHDLQVLSDRGVNLDRDYDLLAETRAPYHNFEIRLYRPKGWVACP